MNLRWLTAGCESPVAGQQSFAIDDDLERHRGEWHDRQEEPGEAEPETPSLVHPHEDRARGVAQEDESVDASDDRNQVCDIECPENERGDEPGQVNISATAKLRKSTRGGLTVLDFSVVVMVDESLTVLTS